MVDNLSANIDKFAKNSQLRCDKDSLICLPPTLNLGPAVCVLWMKTPSIWEFLDADGTRLVATAFTGDSKMFFDAITTAPQKKNTFKIAGRDPSSDKLSNDFLNVVFA